MGFKVIHHRPVREKPRYGHTEKIKGGRKCAEITKLPLETISPKTSGLRRRQKAFDNVIRKNCKILWRKRECHTN